MEEVAWVNELQPCIDLANCFVLNVWIGMRSSLYLLDSIRVNLSRASYHYEAYDRETVTKSSFLIVLVAFDW